MIRKECWRQFATTRAFVLTMHRIHATEARIFGMNK